MDNNNNNEIDNILNELKKKNSSQDDDKTETFNLFDEKPNRQSDNNIEKEDTQHNNFSLINDSFSKDIKIDADDREINRNMKKSGKKQPMDKKKKGIIMGAAVLVVIIIAAVIFAVANSNKEPETTAPLSTTQAPVTQAPVVIANPLTGESGYSESAVGKRPVAIVVENASAARPQWGIADSDNPPDIILEGEVEGGETRMLWFYADYNSVPSQVGPVRSARPPFIRFSTLFDSIFIHWGMSTSKGNYVGADSVFTSEDVDHINQMAYSDKVGLFGRDSSRGVSSEHTGVLYGDKVADAIAGKEFRTDVDNDSFTAFSFNEKDEKVGETACNSVAVTFSSRSRTRDWTYSTSDNKYHSNDYETDVARKNILVLYDTTEYIVKSNYKGSGSNEVYCDYKLAGGNGKLASMGTVCDITWSVEDGKLSVKDASGNDVSLNAGTTWIGWASSNNGGSVTTA